jgi:hypothetical protein
MTMCHIHARKKIGVRTHEHELLNNSDRVLLSGKKWEVSHIKL